MPTIYNEVKVNGVSILSLRGDTTGAATTLDSYTGHDNTGSAFTGSYTPPAPQMQSRTVQYIPSTSAQSETITPASGYDGLSSVTVRVNAMPTGSVNNPTATKGSVSNHAVSVTPSVTYSDGYVSAGAKSGTAVSVSASELVSGTLQITDNGEADCTNYQKVNVQVSGGGGAANYVEGTFTPTTAGAVFDVSVPYTGSGYPVSLVIAPAVGSYNSAEGNFHTLVKRYAINTYCMYKARATDPPTYNTASSVIADSGVVLINYKNSTSTATTYSAAQSTGRRVYSTSVNPSTTNTDTVKIRSSTQFSVMTANTSYGFAAGVEYAYHIMYSE